MAVQVRELGLGEILDQTIELLKSRFLRFVSITLILLVPAALLQGLWTSSTARNGEFYLLPGGYLVLEYDSPASQLLSGVISMFIGLVVAPLTNIAIVHAVASEYTGTPVRLRDAFRRAFSAYLPFLWTTILTTLAVLGGFILIIAPGILFFFWFMLSTEVVIIERVSGVAALQRSRQLMKGNMFKVFALLLLVGFINLAVDGGINFIPQRHVAIIVHAFVQGVTSVFAAAALVVFYYSCRCKFEDFDLLLLAQFVGEADPAEVSVGAEYGE